LRKAEAVKAVAKKILAGKQKELIYKSKFGNVKPIISLDHLGKKIVAVGNRLYFGDHKTVPDFLDDYIKHEFNTTWWNEECKKPDQNRHPLIKLAFLKNQNFKNTAVQEDGLWKTIPDGPTNEFLSVAYDLYILRHHSSLQKKLIKQMRNPDKYHSFRYEAFVAATMIKAGFKIEYEDEGDGSKRHPEFTAVHLETGTKCSVEAKCRNRESPISLEDWNDGSRVVLGITHLINNAIGKAQGLPFILFVELNAPPLPNESFQKPWFKEVFEAPTSSNARNAEGKDLFNIVVFTNRPTNYTIGENPNNSYIFSVSLTPQLPLDQNIINSIHKTLELNGNIPSKFEE
jgi:hypothetical protein